MTVRTSDDRSVRLEGDALAADRLDHGYALTVHRSQGATYDRAHVLAAGGGRELAYVALSRASDHTTIHATADDVPQAVDDLKADWGAVRAQRWVSDSAARPGHEPEPVRVAPPASAAVQSPARSLAERHRDALERRDDLLDDYDHLLAGTGRWYDTPAGTAARNLNDARERLVEARHTGVDPDARPRERRAATKALPQLEVDVERATRAWDQVGEPEAARLRTDIATTDRELAGIARDAMTRRLDLLEARGIQRSIGPDLAIGR